MYREKDVSGYRILTSLSFLWIMFEEILSLWVYLHLSQRPHPVCDILCSWAEQLVGVCNSLLLLISEGSVCLLKVAVSQTTVNLPPDQSVALTRAVTVVGPH